jgi:hypothetical protein
MFATELDVASRPYSLSIIFLTTSFTCNHMYIQPSENRIETRRLFAAVNQLLYSVLPDHSVSSLIRLFSLTVHTYVKLRSILITLAM